HRATVEPRLLLVHFLREVLGLTGTHVGCETSLCGACTVLLDGHAVKSCTVLAVQADSRKVTTVEGLAQGNLHPIQEGFWEEHGKAALWVGKGMKRKEDPRLIQGLSHYTDDLKLPGMLHCVLVRSPHAHAELRAIRTDAARALPGVVGIFTGQDVTGVENVP